MKEIELIGGYADGRKVEVLPGEREFRVPVPRRKSFYGHRDRPFRIEKYTIIGEKGYVTND